MNVRLQDYRLQNLTLQQRFIAIVAFIVVIHFAVGTALWLTFIGSQTINIARNSRPEQFWINLIEWIPFYSRSAKSVTPLALTSLSLYLIPRRPRISSGLICGVIIMSAFCAWYDISSESYDLATFGPPWSGHMNHYFTWWWYHQRPK